MPKEPPRILAINPGSRYLGIAAFRGPELLDWGVKVVSGKTPTQKRIAARLILVALIEQYRPNVLVLKRVHPSRSSRRLNQLVRQIRTIARRRGLRVREHSIEDLKDALCPDARTNKQKLAENLAITYPALIHDLDHEKQNRNPYHVRMFEAVALGTTCYQQIENH